MNTTGNNNERRPQRVLVVDDDLTSREMVRLALEMNGYAVVAAAGVPAARQELTAAGFETFDCVVTDYLMPEATGLELLAWLQAKASKLATIILTGKGEKDLVADSLRGGAVDFLEKPVDLTQLRTAVSRAIAQTRQQRHNDEMRSSVAEMGRTQAWMMRAQTATVPVQVEICFHPKLEAGGDFFSHFNPEPDQYYCLLADVSGHDLRAAYWGAYFQGVVRGMAEGARSLPEILHFFNRLLVAEWNRLSQPAATTSVAVCALAMDFKHQTASVILCGTPAPVYVAPDGRAEFLADQGGSPLGWFEDFGAQSRDLSTAGAGAFLLWTDGVDDLAEKNGVHALSLGWALQQASRSGRRPEVLAAATDDILFVELLLSPAPRSPARWRPLVLERYAGGQAARIDELADAWSRSLELAVPGLDQTVRHDLLLAAREAVLNALQHGCRNDPGQSATFQIGYEPAGQRLRVWVDDPGPGHDFDLVAHENALANGLLDQHRGLVLMHRLSRALIFERHGAGVIMEFGPEPCDAKVISPAPPP